MSDHKKSIYELNNLIEHLKTNNFEEAKKLILTITDWKEWPAEAQSKFEFLKRDIFISHRHHHDQDGKDEKGHYAHEHKHIPLDLAVDCKRLLEEHSKRKVA